MISVSYARKLKESGLTWKASINDFFAIPDRGMDERVFVISDLQSSLDIFRGWPVVTFHGSAEWALDYILTTEVIWLPREDQLREALLRQSENLGDPKLLVEYNDGIYRCIMQSEDDDFEFTDHNCSNVYAKALLHLLSQQESS